MQPECMLVVDAVHALLCTQCIIETVPSVFIQLYCYSELVYLLCDLEWGVKLVEN